MRAHHALVIGTVCVTTFIHLLVFAPVIQGQQSGETREQKKAAIQAAGLWRNVARTPTGYNRVCTPGAANTCPSGLRCIQINITYQDGSPAYTTHRCQNQYCPASFLNIMLDGRPNASSAELIASLRDSDDGAVDVQLACPGVNFWDPQSPNYQGPATARPTTAAPRTTR